MTYIIFELDGVLADSSERAKKIFANGPHPDWDAYNEGVEDDVPILGGKLLIKWWTVRKSKPIVVTARCESTREDTEAWLKKHMPVPIHSVHMRPLGNEQTSVEFKKGVLKNLQAQGMNIVLAFDDCADIVHMYEECGVSATRVFGSSRLDYIEDRLSAYYAGSRSSRRVMPSVIDWDSVDEIYGPEWQWAALDSHYRWILYKRRPAMGTVMWIPKDEPFFSNMRQIWPDTPEHERIVRAHEDIGWEDSLIYRYEEISK